MSFLVPAFNHEAFIEETIRSVWSQGVQDGELIVLDDGSTDRTYQIACSMVPFSPLPMRVLTRPNAGLNRTANELIGAAQGTFICFVPSDDCLVEGSVPVVIQHMMAVPDVQCVYANGLHWRGGTQTGDRLYGPRFASLLGQEPRVVLQQLYVRVPFLLTQACIFRRSFLHEIGGFDEDAVLDDWPFHIKVFRGLLDGGHHRFLDIDMVLYRRHATNASRDVLKQVDRVTDTAERYVPAEFRAELLAHALHSIGLSAVLRRPALGARLLFRSQRYSFSAVRLLSIPVSLVRIVVNVVASRLRSPSGDRT